MGIQNSSITVYGLLLPGLTNLTGRLRYYSFYCWLLYEYTKEYRRNGRERTVRDQQNFIRRAELAMAFLMEGREAKSVVGSMHVDAKAFSVVRGCYDLKSSADFDFNPEHDKYWKYSTGAYIESVSENARELFLSSIREGRLSKNSIEDLEEICLDMIIVESPEWTMLNDILVNKDLSGSSFRRDSIYLMLDSLKQSVDVKRFPTLMFMDFEKGINVAVLGWHYYYLCEALHYCIETIFWMILSNASRRNYCPVDSFMDMCQNSILKEEYDLFGFANKALSEIVPVYDRDITSL